MFSIELSRAIAPDREREVEEAQRRRRLLDVVESGVPERATDRARTSRRASPTGSSDTAFGRAF